MSHLDGAPSSNTTHLYNLDACQSFTICLSPTPKQTTTLQPKSNIDISLHKHMSARFDRAAPLELTMTAEHESSGTRGRKRDRSMTRTSVKDKPLRAEESSTLRGRSRQRATSPMAVASRNSSPSLMSPTRHLLLYNRLRESRREHCPSRVPSPRGKTTMRRRTRSRSRGPRKELESHRAPDHQSSLRNEVLLNDEAPGGDKKVA